MGTSTADSRIKLEKFVSKYLDIKGDFNDHRDLVEEARSYMRYAKHSHWTQIARSLNNTLARLRGDGPELVHRTPAKNNKGEGRKYFLSADDILRRTRYNFQSNVVQMLLGEEGYKDFVNRYAELSMRRKGGALYWVPNRLEMDLYYKFEKEEVTLEEVQNQLGLNSKAKAMERIGKIYVYKKEQSRARQASPSGHVVSGETTGGPGQGVLHTQTGQSLDTRQADPSPVSSDMRVFG